MDRIKILQEIPHKDKEGIFIVNVPTMVSASKTVRKILSNYCDLKTALFLSGGKTPAKLYEEIAKEKVLKVGTVLMVDERFGEKMHKKSNELMIKNTGLLNYFEEQNVRFYPIIENQEEIEKTSQEYDETLRFVLKFFPKSVGILGVGADGHTAGVPSGNSKSQNTNPKLLEITKRILEDQSSLVTYYDDESAGFGQRITMTFRALEMLDLLLVLIIGQEKREMLSQMFKDGKVEEMPARFYKLPQIAQKTILITDQIV